MLRKLFTALTLMAAAYALWPAWNALELKRAIRNGDLATVAERVEWPALRASLRTAFADQAPEEARRRFGRVPVLGRLVEKAALRFGPKVADTMVDNFATPAGFIQLDAYKRERQASLGVASSRALSGIAVELYERIKRVSFISLTRIEIEVADRLEPAKRVLGAMELRDGGWKLTELRFFRAVD